MKPQFVVLTGHNPQRRGCVVHNGRKVCSYDPSGYFRVEDNSTIVVTAVTARYREDIPLGPIGSRDLSQLVESI